ncbi:hypothetical protein SGFS_055900 [Streptomyces graminofaciens]|uniref:Regulatory protein n=1 Tax=Streptomyces graminofaciens TaxID=68212 RepID=A0ABM7FDU3_9ACTN|nr:hypothetical protein [Streptomyces graminofaciens]BBC34296.1 hypothetical protein SGFS_055900 [Streptomyces graminofaciens]
MPPQPQPQPQPQPHAENGRGLLLLDGLAREWGVGRGSPHGHPAPDKRVWFELRDANWTGCGR